MNARCLAALLPLLLSTPETSAQQWDLFRFRYSNPPQRLNQRPVQPAPLVIEDPFVRSERTPPEVPISAPPPSQRRQSVVTAEVPNRANTRWQILAESVEGRPIEMTTFGRGSEKILVVGPLAGDQVAGIGMIDKLVDFLEMSPEKLGAVELTLVRDPNPDGNARFQRENSHGVELNRNFPAADWEKIPHQSRWISGRTPNSEPETKALVKLIGRLAPDRLVVLQADQAQVGVSQAGTPSDWAAWIAEHSELEQISPKAVSVAGSLTSFASRDRNIPTLVMIVPADGSAQRNWNRYGPALLSSLNRKPQRSTPPPGSWERPDEEFARPTRHELGNPTPIVRRSAPSQSQPRDLQAMPRALGPQGQSLPLFGPLVPLEDTKPFAPAPTVPSRREAPQPKPEPLFRKLFPKANVQSEPVTVQQESVEETSEPREQRDTRLPQAPIPIYQPK